MLQLLKHGALICQVWIYVHRVIRMSGAAWAFLYVRLAFWIPVCTSTCSEKPIVLLLNKNISSFSLVFLSYFFIEMTLFFALNFKTFSSVNLKEKQDWCYNWLVIWTKYLKCNVFSLRHLFLFKQRLHVSWFSAAPLTPIPFVSKCLFLIVHLPH